MMGRSGAAKTPDGEVQTVHLFLGQHNEEGLEEDQSLAQAGIQIKMTRVKNAPAGGRVQRIIVPQVLCGIHEPIANFFHDLFQG